LKERGSPLEVFTLEVGFFYCVVEFSAARKNIEERVYVFFVFLQSGTRLTLCSVFLLYDNKCFLHQSKEKKTMRPKQSALLITLLLCVFFVGCSKSNPTALTSDQTETWIQEHNEGDAVYEQFVFSVRDGAIVGGHGQSFDDSGHYTSQIVENSITISPDVVTCALIRSDGKSGSLRIISRDATTMRATVVYLAPGQVQNFLPILRTLKKQ
jgi:hypothetical protein